MPTQQSVPPGEARVPLTRSTVFPLVGDRATWRQEHLLPIFVTLVVAIALFGVPFPWPQRIVNGKPAPAEITEAWQVLSILALYIAFMVNYYVNQMCDRARPGWLLALAALFTFVLMSSPVWDYWASIFYIVIPGQSLEKSPNAAAQIAGNIFGTGLAEEGVKAFPLLVLALLGAGFGLLSRHTGRMLGACFAGLRRHICLNEPLDGIVLGVASGSGFFIQETLGQYVPAAMSHEKYPAAQAFEGLVILLARGLPDLAEHSAWAGLAGYFVGLAVLRPTMTVILLPIGWLSAAALHGAWDASSDLIHSAFIVPVWIAIGLLSYALLAGAISKARNISPRLTQQSAPRVKPQSTMPIAVLAAAVPAALEDDSG